LNSLRCCLNPTVIGSLAVAGLAVWLVAPRMGTAALPLLIALVCPLSMGVMAWRMRRGVGGEAATTGGSLPIAGSGDADAQLRALREEIAAMRAHRQLAGRDDHRPA
jgi:hypothetical protein